MPGQRTKSAKSPDVFRGPVQASTECEGNDGEIVAFSETVYGAHYQGSSHTGNARYSSVNETGLPYGDGGATSDKPIHGFVGTVGNTTTGQAKGRTKFSAMIRPPKELIDTSIEANDGGQLVRIRREEVGALESEVLVQGLVGRGGTSKAKEKTSRKAGESQEQSQINPSKLTAGVADKARYSDYESVNETGLPHGVTSDKLNRVTPSQDRGTSGRRKESGCLTLKGRDEYSPPTSHPGLPPIDPQLKTEFSQPSREMQDFVTGLQSKYSRRVATPNPINRREPQRSKSSAAQAPLPQTPQEGRISPPPGHLYGPVPPPPQPGIAPYPHPALGSNHGTTSPGHIPQPGAVRPLQYGYLPTPEEIVVERGLTPSQILPSRTIDFICWPDSGKFGFRSTSALKFAGTLSQTLLHQRLPVIFENGNGGCLIAVVCDTDCQTWVEEHFDDDLLVKIREKGIGGPLPSVMGISQPALVLFGASANGGVLHFAEALANHSMYPVIVQPSSENPASNLQHFSKDIGASSEPLHDDSGGDRRGGGNGGSIQHGKGEGTSTGRKRAWKGDEDLPDDDMDESDDRDGEDKNGKDRNASDIDMDDDGFGNPHTTMVALEFNIGKAQSSNLQRLYLERHVKFKRKEGENRSLESLARDCNVQVQLIVTPSGDGAEVKQCGSQSKLSFLAHAAIPHVMNKVTYLRGPNDPAPQRLKNATASAKTAEGGFHAGLSGKVTGKWGKTTTRTLEIQDSSDLPESGWFVRYFGAHSNEGEGIQTTSLDAKFERIDFSGGRRSLQERLDVIYGMGANLLRLQEPPKIGFVAQDSIDVWIPMKSKAKHAGIMLMVLDYIADISKDTSPLIRKVRCHEHTSDHQSEDVLVDSSSSLQGREVGIALGINSKPPASPGKLDGLARKVANYVGWQDTEEVSSLSPSDIRDMFPAALGWDWKNQEVISSVWASVEALEANGWKIIRGPRPPPLPPKEP